MINVEFSPLTAAATVTLLGRISCLALLTSLTYNVHSPHLLSHNEPIVSVHLQNHPFSSWPSALTFWFPRRPAHCSFHTFLPLPTRGLPSPSLPGFVGCWIFAVWRIHTAFSDCTLLCITPYLRPFALQVLTSFQAPGHKEDHIAGNNGLPSSLPFPISLSTPPPPPPPALGLTRCFPPVITSLVVKFRQSSADWNKHIEAL